MKLTNNTIIKIYVKDKIESISLAVEDLIEDLKRLSFSCEVISCEKDADFVFAIDDKLKHKEEYCYEIKSNRVNFYGQNDLGVLWSIYTFIEDELCIPPFYKLDDIALKTKKEIVLKDKIVNDYPKARFRGWFVNDEDLLENFRIFGHRDVDYIYYHHVIHPEIFYLVVEAALRNRVNLIIPSTLIDLKNDDEKTLVDIASRRGMYVSQHHIEPLGVSHFALERYFKNHQIDGDISYITNKKAYVDCWEEYTKLWSKYPRVIYQLGLRGRGDKPVWYNDSNIQNSDLEKGIIITSAINEQYKIVKKYNKNNDIHFSSTLWMEAANLLKEGYLFFPKEVVIVFSDLGLTSLPGEDFYRFDRKTISNNFGFYYHIAYFHVGSHLYESVSPQKMQYVYDLLDNYNNDYYLISNVANVRDFTYSIYLNSHLMFEGKTTDIESMTQKYVSYLTRNKISFIKMIEHYFSSITDGLNAFYRTFCQKNNFSYHEYKDLPFPIFGINDGYLRWFIKREMVDRLEVYDTKLLVSFDKSLKELDLAIEQLNKIEPYDKKSFDMRWKNQVLCWKQMVLAAKEIYLSIDSYKENDLESVIKHYTKAKKELEIILEIRKKYCVGYYSNWYEGDQKTGIKGIIEYLDNKINNKEL